MNTLLEVTGLGVRYGAVEAVRSVDLVIYPGEIVGLVGPNGAGKSSTLLSVCGAVQSAVGSVKLKGDEISNCSPETIVRSGLALVPEGRRVLARLTVLENLRVGAIGLGQRVGPSVEDVVSRFPGLTSRLSQLAGSLSGGEQQQLAIARALMSAPDLLLIDEPSLGLAPLLVASVFELLRDLPSRGISVLLVEQNVRRTLDIVSRVYVMSRGQVEFEGDARQAEERGGVESAYLRQVLGPT